MNISETEWQVMEVVWENPACSATDIHKALDGQDWSLSTVKTLIGRLVKKKAIDYKKEGKKYFYHALVERREVVKSERKRFVEKVFDGSVQEFIMNFVSTTKMSEKEIEDLRRILDEKEKEL